MTYINQISPPILIMTKNMKTTTQITRDEALNNFAALLLDNGFTIITPKGGWAYFHFAKDGKIGYVQYNYYGGYTFSTVHKPCRECGTGFRFSDTDFDDLTLENAINCANCFAPNWASRSDRSAVKKYESLDAFIHATPFSRVNDLILTPNN